MPDTDTLKSKKNTALKIVLPVILICIVFGIWAMKNKENDMNYVNIENTDFTLLVTEKIDLEKLKSYGFPIVIDFGADSCVPCKEMAPILKELNEELQGKAIIKFVDVWKYHELADDYPINVIPTQIFIDAKGKPYNPKNPEAIQMKLYSQRDTDEHVFTTHEGGMTKDQIMTALREMGLE
ncbi:thioredoxin family protein [Calidifontibacillus oryziterrae]|uniref:thioredoxin family protein n=1 Tax=Calidifontibacillus oryziterrae TaxID=1191699 RepID=UPI0003140C66|nr:thioredoxin family protein [Calidifontibacillus oryziterrae]